MAKKGSSIKQTAHKPVGIDPKPIVKPAPKGK